MVDQKQPRATIEVFDGTAKGFRVMRYVRLLSRDAVGVRVAVDDDGEEWTYFVPYTSIRRMQLIE